MDLCVITPCSRPDNLPLLRNSIPSWMNWIIVFDTDNYKLYDWFNVIYLYHRGGHVGKPQINYALNAMSNFSFNNQFLYVLDDDNIMHPNLPRLFDDCLNEDLKYDFIYFDQELYDGSIRKPKLKVGEIDQAQYIFKLSGLRFENNYTADGIFAEKYTGRKKYLSKTLSYYNKIR